ncbi:hypothetical protein M422DRAFT_252708 [Sphaerobolus stellatus SS14]|uniref:Retrotransposon gag domain-containing protein n=1 Tax=Sphaerobolus stellatus (strain SS14) TaxID=990650 RepID=A0A0C9VA09_SPHS4|nr:hypothetical protein M422DRAFT_252708 [Sphaerobolus stellatus SS14]
MRENQSIDMNALREEIKEIISATIKEKLCSDADSVTTVSQAMTALDANAQYWSDLSNKAARHGHRALELQLKMAEEKVNILLHEEAPEEALLEAAQEILESVNNPSREYGVNSIHEAHIARPEADAPLPQQSTPALSMTAQLDGAVVNNTSEYDGIQQMVRQAIQNASHEAKLEKSFQAKASVKMGNPPTYSGEHNLEKFENWVVSVLCFMSMYNLLGPQVGKVQLQFLEWFDQEIKHWDLESVIMGLQKWFMPTLSMNKVTVNYDTIMQGSMTVQQHHQELSKLAKQMIELPDVYSYRRRFMNALKPGIREQVLRKGFTPEFSSVDELVDEAVMFDNAKCYTSDYNSNHGSSYLQKAAAVEHSCAQHITNQNKGSMNQNAGSSKQHKSGNNPVQRHPTTQLLSTGGGNVRVNPTYSKNPVKPGNTVNKPTQSNPIRTALKTNNTVDRRVAGARIEEVILEEFDENAPHPEEQQDWEDQPKEDDQQYHFDDEEYETRSIDNEVVRVNAVIKDSGYNDHCRLYGIRVWEAETDLRVSAVVQTGEKEQPVYDHQARRKAQPLPTRGKENETISVFWDISGTKAHCLLDTKKLPKFELEKPVILQLACVGSKSTVQHGLTAKILLSNEKYDEYFDSANVNYYDIILGTPFLCWFEILLDFNNNCVKLGKLSFPNRFGNIAPTEADKNENSLLKEKPKALPAPTSK